MNIFDSAIETHAEWKLMLLQQLNHGNVEIDVNTVNNPHLCELGQWIDAQGTQYSFLPSFQRMCAEHEQFHRLSGDLIHSINAGELEKAKEMLLHAGPLRQSSAKLVTALMECGKELDSPTVKVITLTDTLNDILKDKGNRAIIEVDCALPPFWMPLEGMIDANTVYVQRGDSIERCMLLMTSTRTRHLPVMQEGRLIGIISIGDLVKKVVRHTA